MKLLLIEDDKNLSEVLKSQLEKAHFVVDVAANGEDALYQTEEYPYDCIILDLGLPDMSGFEVCKKIRASHNTTPILILTAREDYYLPVTFFDALKRVQNTVRLPQNTATILLLGDTPNPQLLKAALPNDVQFITTKLIREQNKVMLHFLDSKELDDPNNIHVLRSIEIECTPADTEIYVTIHTIACRIQKALANLNKETN